LGLIYIGDFMHTDRVYLFVWSTSFLLLGFWKTSCKTS